MRKLRVLFLLVSFFSLASAQKVTKQDIDNFSPLQLAKFVADKVVDHTQFGYDLSLQPLYPDIEFVDFGKNINNCMPGISYALTTLNSEKTQVEEIEVGRTGPLKIWVNGKLVFNKIDTPDFQLEFDEKTYILPEKITIALNKGDNNVLIKSYSSDTKKWWFFLQSKNLGRYAEKEKKIRCTLRKYAPKIKDANWLVLGAFDGDINTVFEPEINLDLFHLYSSDGKMFTWNIPRTNLLINNKDDGKFSEWSYSVGCFMWSLQRLSQITGDKKYLNFADKWCDFVLSTRPLVNYQTRELQAVRSMNFGLAGRPMLDYTSAPAMPFVARLVFGGDFPLKNQYKCFSDSILAYLQNRQVRYDGVFARTYTNDISIWADDMFMGLPYLIYSAKVTSDKKLSSELIDDAARQVVIFSKYLQDPQLGLYMQACYPKKIELKVPFWSRGNGWALWATSEVLKVLSPNHSFYKQLLKLFRKQVDGLVSCQNSDGSWNNVLTMKNSVRESSGTAIFTFCLARGINEGWLSKKKYASSTEKAWKATRSFVDENGDFNGVKGGTNFSTDPSNYERTPLIKSDTHGLLPLIFACIEMEKYFTHRQ